MPRRSGGAILRSGSIRNRLLATILLTCLMPLLLLSVYTNRRYTKSLERKIAETNAQTLDLVNVNMFTELEKYQYLCGSICVNMTVQDALKRVNLTDSQKNRIILDIQDYVRNQIIYPAQAKNITVYNRQGEIFYDLGYDGLYAEDAKRVLDDVRSLAPNDSWTYARTYRSRDIIILARRIMDGYSDVDELGYALVWIDERLFSSTMLKKLTIAEGANIFMMRPDGLVLSSWDRSTALGQPFGQTELVERIAQNAPSKSGSFDLITESEKYLVNYSYNRNLDLYFVSMLPSSYVTSETGAISRRVVMLSGALIFVCVLIALALYMSISRPIGRMVTFVNRMAGGELNERLNDPNHDELSHLSRHIDRMVDKIEQLLAAQEKDDQKKRELELQMLRYQINPHFLFNTLNSLRFVAGMNGDHVTGEAILALSNLLKSSLMDKNEYIPISEELQNLRNYFALQSIRFAGDFTVRYELDETLECYLAPKLILQPLAENAIMHGRTPGGDALKITVGLAPSGEDIAMTISDNGSGFDPQNAPPKGTGIGISNISDRLRLSFGAEYGLRIESSPGRGTRCLILLPKLSIGGDADDTRDDS